MTPIIAHLVGSNSKVIAIDNNENQINAARARTPDNLNIEYKVHDIYELNLLDHKSVLKSGSMYIGIEGIMNYAYSYPSPPAWQPPNLPYEIAEGDDCNEKLGLD